MIKNKKENIVLTEKTIPTCSACEKNPPAEEHSCPFASEIHGDDISMCDCCESCEHNCAMDI